MPRLSIVIPCLAGIDPLEVTLASVLQNRPEECEIIVAHSGEYDDPYDLAEEVRFIETAREALPAEIVGAACDAARGTVLHLLEAGTEVSEDWTTPALSHFDDASVAAVAPLVLAADRKQVISAGIVYGPGGGRWIRRSASLARRRDQRQDVLGPTLAAAFYRTSVLQSAGGIDPSAGLAMADVELALSLKARGFRAVLEPECLVFSTAACRSGETAFQQGWCAERVFWRHASEMGWFPSLVMHPVLVAGEFAAGLSRGGALNRLLGRAVACLSGGQQTVNEEEAASPDPEPATSARRNVTVRIDRAHERRTSPRPRGAASRKRAA